MERVETTLEDDEQTTPSSVMLPQYPLCPVTSPSLVPQRQHEFPNKMLGMYPRCVLCGDLATTFVRKSIVGGTVCDACKLMTSMSSTSSSSSSGEFSGPMEGPEML